MITERLRTAERQPMRLAPMPLETTVPEEERPYVDSIRDWIYGHTGLHFGPKKYFTLYRRLQTVCWRLRIASLEELDHRLREPVSAEMAVELVYAVSTHHTYFFRELEVLQHLQATIVPKLPADEEWRIWSAATASGEEAFTTAILMAEAIGLEPASQRVAILGTDLSQPMIELAENGVYEANRLEQTTFDRVSRCFEPLGSGRWRVAQALRQMCTFRQMNLLSQPWPFQKPFHVILCRNVLYYFDAQEQRSLIESMYEATVPGGWLITSVTETPSAQATRWRKLDVGLFRKV